MFFFSDRAHRTVLKLTKNKNDATYEPDCSKATYQREVSNGSSLSVQLSTIPIQLRTKEDTDTTRQNT